MAEFDLKDLTPDQRSALERLLRAGFRFMTLERVERNLAVERNGFVALLELSAAGIKIFGQAGRLMDQGIGMLVEQSGGKVFQCHGETIEASPEMLAEFARMRGDLERALAPQA